MANYLTMFDPNEANKDFIFAADLDEREHTVQIERVEVGALTGENGKKTKKPVLSFRGKTKKLAINKTNGKIIAKLYGKDTDAWLGKLITIFPTTTKFGGETVDCIRVKPHVPQPPMAQGTKQQQANRDTKPSNNAPPTSGPNAGPLPPADLSPAEIAELERLEREEAERGR